MNTLSFLISVILFFSPASEEDCKYYYATGYQTMISGCPISVSSIAKCKKGSVRGYSTSYNRIEIFGPFETREDAQTERKVILESKSKFNSIAFSSICQSMSCE